jgi:tetratricopeptide (TPR) repeat protein
MSRPGSTERWLATAALALALEACTLGNGGGEPAPVADVVPPAFTARYDEALARVAAGDDAGAAAAFRALVAAYPEYAGPSLNLALIEARAGRDAAALAWLGGAAKTCSRCGAVWTEAGVIHRKAGRLKDAERAYQRAIELEAGYGLAYYNLAVLYDLYLQRPELALETYRRYQASSPDASLNASVSRWVTDLERRVANTTVARTEDGP